MSMPTSRASRFTVMDAAVRDVVSGAQSRPPG